MRTIRWTALMLVLPLLSGCLDPSEEDSGSLQDHPSAQEDASWDFTNVIVDDAVYKITEPSIEVSPDGTIWITGPNGFTRGVTSQDPLVYTHDHGLFSSTDGGATWVPNIPLPIPDYGRDICPGGGDSDLAIAPDGAMFLVDLNLATVPLAMSLDGGESWDFNCASNLVPVQDRQWVEASDDYLWVMANQLPAGPMVWRSDRSNDLTDIVVFDAPIPTPVSGPIERDAFTGNLYLGGTGSEIARSQDEGVTWEGLATGNTLAHRGPFANVAVDSMGNLFHTGGGSDGVWVVASTDQGDSFLEPQIIKPYEGQYMFAWGAATGEGDYFAAWYGKPVDADGWYLYAAQSRSVLDGDLGATLRVSVVDPVPVTTKTICSGTGCDVIGGSEVTRMLGDFFETAIDTEGNFVITYDRVSDSGDPILMFATAPIS